MLEGDDDFEDFPRLKDDEDVEAKYEDDQFSKDLSSQKGLTLNLDNRNLRSENGNIVLRYNRYDVPVGLDAIALSTFLGVLARVSVPIIYKDWRLVPDKYKEALWSFVQV